MFHSIYETFTLRLYTTITQHHYIVIYTPRAIYLNFPEKLLPQKLCINKNRPQISLL